MVTVLPKSSMLDDVGDRNNGFTPDQPRHRSAPFQAKWQ
jgi:hypothetical protein